MSATESPSPPSSLAPFRYPTFRAIWIANLASNMGSMIQSVGAAWLMTELTASHQLIALVQAGATIPILLLGVFAGAIADNFDRRRVMLAAQSGMLVVSAALTITTWMGALSPLLLLLFTLAVGCGTALNGPAWQASVRLQVGPKDLPQAIALNSIAFNLARSVGPAAGGLLIQIDGKLQLPAHALAQAPGQLRAVLHGHAFHGNEGAHIAGAHAWVRTAVTAHIQHGESLLDAPEGGLHHGIRIAHEGHHRTVGVGTGIHI